MWRFPEHTGGKIEDPVQEAFFADATDNNTAIHLVRESIQNSLDARRGAEPVRIRFTFGTLAKDMIRVVYDGLDGHLTADGNGLKNPPGPYDDLRYLAIEDFGTTGLTGDVNLTSITGATDEDHFFYFFRNVGRSGKGEGTLGSWGLGKQVFPASSEINTCFGLTCREGDPNMYLMGICVLKHHEKYETHHTPYGHYAKWSGGNPYPITDVSRIDRFRASFHLERTSTEPGLSVVVPHVVEDFNPAMLEDEVIENYFWPILNGDLVIEIQQDYQTPPETILNAESMSGVPDRRQVDRELADTIRLAERVQSGSLSTSIQPNVKSSNRAARWEDVVPLDSELEDLASAARLMEPFAVTVYAPVWQRNGTKTISPFRVYGQRVNYQVKRRSYFVRGGISISRACEKNPTDFIFIVVATGPELSSMLKSAENPSHVSFINTTELKQSHTSGITTIKFVASAPGAIASWLEREQVEEDPGLFSDVFYKRVESGATRRSRRTRRNRPPRPVIERTPRRWEIARTAGGFSVYDGGNESPLPRHIDVWVAYDADVNDPFKEHNPWDFDLTTLDDRVTVTANEQCTVERLSPNRIRLTDPQSGFKAVIDGFDTRRDVRTRVRTASQ